jgi:FKBP-type peptidyl-prolyl cis-trans isomerase FkpA
MKKIAIFLCFFLLALPSCRDKVQVAPHDFTGEKSRENETLVSMNTYVAKRNKELISQFVKRTGIDLKETGSGLWFRVYEKGNGKIVKQGDMVDISYTVKLLDGTTMDSVSVSRPKIFRSGKGGVEAGLEEGIILMREGDRAWFIIPPHLAFGNFGDQEKISPGAILFYDLYLMRVKP